MNHVISRIALDSVSWTPITAGQDCDAAELENITSVNLKLRSDETDPNSETTVQPMLKYIISSPTPKNTRLMKNETLIFAQLASGSDSILRRTFSDGRIT